MRRSRRVWRTLGDRRRIGPCRTCGVSLGLHNRAQRVYCLEQPGRRGEFVLLDENLEAIALDSRRVRQQGIRRRFDVGR